MELRDYQVDVIDRIRRKIAQGFRRILLVAPTGSGKTVIAAQIVRSAMEKMRQSLFLAHRRELVNQCSEKLERFGVWHGLIMAGEVPTGAVDAQVASIDTLRSRSLKSDRLPLPRADLLLIDEAHRALAKTYRMLVDIYWDTVLIGLTATPIRSDGKGMGQMFDTIVECPSVQELTDMEHLVPARPFCPNIPDLTGIPIVRGDYDERALQEAMDKRRLVGDIVSHWCRLASDRPTVVFATGVQHSLHLRDEFLKVTHRVAHVDGNTPLTTRKAIVRDLASGALQVVCNYGVLTEGFDEPRLSAAVLARPTKNLGTYLQMAGRILRPCPPTHKKDALLIDHSGNTYEHGFVSDRHEWLLDIGRATADNNADRQRKFDEQHPITCIQCTRTYTGQRVCPYCGHVPERQGKYVETLHGELVELRGRKRRTAKRKQFTIEEKQEWFRMLLGYASDKGHQPGSAYHRYRQKFKESVPPEFSTLPMAPSNEVKSWCRGMQIRFIKGKQAGERKNKRQRTG